MNLVAADVSPLHLKVRADSRRLLQFKGQMREFFQEISRLSTASPTISESVLRFHNGMPSHDILPDLTRVL